MSILQILAAMDLPIASDCDLVASARIEGDAVILVLRGKIDRLNSGNLRDTIVGLIALYAPRRLELNLEQVPFIDSTACAAFIEAVRRMRACHGEVCLVSLQPLVKGLLEIARLGPLFTIV